MLPSTQSSARLLILISKNQELGCPDQVLVLVSTKYSNQDKSRSQTRFVISQTQEFSKTLGIDWSRPGICLGVNIILDPRQVLVLVEEDFWSCRTILFSTFFCFILRLKYIFGAAQGYLLCKFYY